MHRVFLPFPNGAAGIAPPCDLARSPCDADDIDVAVAVHVKQQVAEIVDVVVPEQDRAEFLALEIRPAEPVLPGDDVKEAVAIDVGHRTGLVAPKIDHVLPKRNLRGRPLGKTGGGCNSQEGHGGRLGRDP